MMPATLPVEVDTLKEACISSYATFAKLMQEDGWFDPIHEQLCDWVQYHVLKNIDAGKDVKLQITMPRGSLKSTIVTKYLPIWLTLQDTNFRTLIAANTYPNASRKLQDIRGIFDTNEVFRALFPELLPTSSCKWTNEAACIPRSNAFPESTFEAAGMKTRVTSRHYNLIVEDDTVAPAEDEMKGDVTLPSVESIELAIGWHKNATPLLVPKGTRVRVVVTTRWGDFDLVSHVREQENYLVFDVPALDPEGDPVFSMFYSKEKLEEIESQVGPYMFQCLYMNNPMDSTLRVFKSEWFNYMYPHELPDEGYYTLAIDPAISEKDSACETAITFVKHCPIGARSYAQIWLKAVHGYFNPFETANKALDLLVPIINAEGGEKIRSLLVESNAYQGALKYVLWDEMAKRGISVPINAFQTRSNKKVRIEGMVPLFASGKIYFLRGLDPQVESQLKQFPMGKLVDVIDSFSMHRRVSLHEEFPTEEKAVEKKDFMDCMAILEEVQKAYNKRNGIGRDMLDSELTNRCNPFVGLRSDLGVMTDSRLMFGRN
ncbi:MAG: hypothetical protein GY861_25200 [bacterium]|nr:hypothetical protein [bacterium]